MATRRGRYVVIALIALLGLSSWRTFSSEQARRQVTGEYAKAQDIIAQLQGERQTLAAELTTARETITGHEATISTMQQQLQTVSARLEETATQLASLREEHNELQEAQDTMAQQMETLEAEKLALEQRLSSLKELRLAIRDVKHKLWLQRVATWRARIDAQRELDRQQLAAGNNGFVVRKGLPTLGTATRLQVHVLEPESR